MRNGVVTIVIPIYNVELFLDRCLKSVVDQTYINLEIILVDDGSTDKCPEICNEWAKKDKRIKVVHKVNAGLGMARNTGIENATGEYICFFDSDDYIALDAIEKLYGLAKKEQADVVTFGFNYIKRDGSTGVTIVPETGNTTYSGEEVQEVFLPELIEPDLSKGKKTGLWMSACANMYSMKLIQKTGWRFVSERIVISEDIYSLLYLLKSVQKVSILSEALYFYCENTNSLTQTYRKDRYEKIKHFYDQCQKACDELGYSKEVKTRLSNPYITNTIGCLKMIVSADCSRIEKKKTIKTIIKDQHLQSVLNNINFKRKSKAIKILLLAMKNKIYTLCFFLIKIKSK